MPRRIENPQWRTEWYERYQGQYSKWLEQARQKGIKIQKNQVINKLGDIEEYLSGQLGVSAASIRSWRREKGSSGAAYPQDEKLLREVWRLLMLPGPMEEEDREMISALYWDFAHLLQGSARAFFWERSGGYRDILERQGLHVPAEKWSYMDLEKRCEFLGRLKEKYLSPEDIYMLQDFYTRIASPENCGSQVFERLCDGEKIWSRVLKILKNCQSTEKAVLEWLNEAKVIGELKMTANRRMDTFYWHLMDEYLEEWQKKVSDRRRIKDFNLLRLALTTGYVPFLFEEKFVWAGTDLEQMQKEYTSSRLGVDEVIFDMGGSNRSISVREYEKIYDWFRKKQTELGAYRCGYLNERRNVLDRELQEAGNLEEILQSMEEDFGADEMCMAVYSDGSALDRAACVIFASREYHRSHSKAVRIGFESRGNARESRQSYEAAGLSRKEKGQMAALYFRQIVSFKFLQFWCDREKAAEAPFFSEKMAKRLGEPLLEHLVQYMMCLVFNEDELAKNLRGIQESLALREHLLPELSEYVENIHWEVLEEAGVEDSSVLGIVRRLKKLLEE